MALGSAADTMSSTPQTDRIGCTNQFLWKPAGFSQKLELHVFVNELFQANHVAWFALEE